MSNRTKVGYGYNVLNTSYIEPSGIKERYPILDLSAENVETSSAITTEIIIATASSLSELTTDFNQAIGISGTYELFSASVDVDYHKDTKETKSYAYTKLMGLHRRSNHFITNGDKYKNNFTSQFKQDLEGSAAMDPFEFFNCYGTHLVTEISYGGRFEIAFTTEMTENDTVESIKVNVKAAYDNLISAKSKTDYTETTKNIINRSKLNFKCVGGDGVVILSLDGLSTKYETWVKSLNSSDNQEICDVPDRKNIESILVPLWEFCSSTQRANELKAVFLRKQKELNNGGQIMKTNLAKFDYIIDANGKKINLNNHMVTSVSQYSINQAMKEYLNKNVVKLCAFTLCVIDDQNKSVYFQLYPNTDVSTMPTAFPDELRKQKNLYTKLSELNLFDIPAVETDRTPKENGYIEEAYNDYYLCSGYRFQSGLPSSYDEDEKLAFRPLDLNPSNDPTTAGVLYTQSFKDFQIIELKENRRKLIFSKTSQADFKDPWMYQYTIKFSLNDVEFKKLSEEVKQQVRNHFKLEDSQIASLFTMAQLKLDLLTLAVSSVPKIQGIQEETQANLKVILDKYIQQDMADAFAIGHIIVPKESCKDYFFMPKRYTFSVSDAIEYNGKKDEDMKMLNYVISFDDADPIPQLYNWEWINPQYKLVQSGVMAINRDKIFERFNEEFRGGVLGGLRKTVTATMEGNHKGLWDVKWVYKFGSDSSIDTNRFLFDEEKGLYKYVSCGEGEKTEGTRSYSHAGKISFYIPPTAAGTADFTLEYTMKSTSHWGHVIKDEKTYPAIVFTVDVVAWTDIVYDSGHSKGNVYNHTIKCYVGFDVDGLGNVTLIKVVENIDNGSNIDKSDWAMFASFGGIGDVVDGISGTINGWVNNSVDTFKNKFLCDFKHNAAWIMPGYKTFSFKNESFSENGDFCVEVTYE